MAITANFGGVFRLGCLLFAISTTAMAAPFFQSPPAKVPQKGVNNPAAFAVQFTTVPNLVGQTASQAIRTLQGSRLKGDVIAGNGTGTESGIVLSQNPAPGARLLPGKTVTITVGKPGISLGLDTARPEVMKPVTVTATMTPAVTNAYYYFDWGDGHKESRQTSAIRSHQYANTGTYAITVSALVDDINLSASTSVTVIQPAPNYSLQVEAANPTVEAGSTGMFTAKLAPPSPSGSFVEYCFNWGDRSPSTCSRTGSDTITADHSFGNQGNYNVIATANFAGEKTVSSAPVQINVLPPPQVHLKPETIFPVRGQKTRFTIVVTGQLAANVPIRYCFSWESGKEECQDSPNISHAFSGSGVYRVGATVEQNGTRFEATPVVLRVYELSLTPVSFRTETDKPIKFAARVSPESLSGAMEYCFHWGDGTQSCGSQSSVEHPFASQGTYRASVVLFINKREVATSAEALVEIGTSVWPSAILWIGGLLGILCAGYGIIRELRTRPTAKQTMPATVRVVPKLDELPQYRIAKSQALAKCHVRIRWVRTPADATINPQRSLIRRKGDAHAV